MQKSLPIDHMHGQNRPSCRSGRLVHIIVNSLPEYTNPKNVGLMFFCLNPQRFFPYAQIDVVQFLDGLGGDTIIEKIFEGPIYQQLREALLYISNTIVQERFQKMLEVAEVKRFFNYPYEAIEEALANAVYHKGYNERDRLRYVSSRTELKLSAIPAQIAPLQWMG